MNGKQRSLRSTFITVKLITILGVLKRGRGAYASINGGM